MWLNDTFTLSVECATMCARPTSQGGHKPDILVCVLGMSSPIKKKLYFIAGKVHAAKKIGASKQSVDKVIFF